MFDHFVYRLKEVEKIKFDGIIYFALPSVVTVYIAIAPHTVATIPSFTHFISQSFIRAAEN